MKSTEAQNELHIPPFHLAIPSNDLNKSKYFYGQILGCKQGRSCPNKWVDYNFYGHQLVCHFTSPEFKPHDFCNNVDLHDVPVPHFGLVLSVEQWHKLKDIVKQADIKFIVEPHLRFEGKEGEQWTMFFKDPTGNNLQFKAMTKPENLFKAYTTE